MDGMEMFLDYQTNKLRNYALMCCRYDGEVQLLSAGGGFFLNPGGRLVALP
jgi:hypothetical protein